MLGSFLAFNSLIDLAVQIVARDSRVHENELGIFAVVPATRENDVERDEWPAEYTEVCTTTCLKLRANDPKTSTKLESIFGESGLQSSSRI